MLDSCGVGYEPDADKFGDVGADTLRRCATSSKFDMTNLVSMGLGNLDGIDYLPKCEKPTAALARLQERSMGKDTTIGHWEIAGIVSENPLPTYPHGFPKEVIDEFSRLTGRKVLCNLPYSGTDVIRDYGREQVETGALIVYTSADSFSRSPRTRMLSRPSSSMNTAALRESFSWASMAWEGSSPDPLPVNGRTRERRDGTIFRSSRRRKRFWTRSWTQKRT